MIHRNVKVELTVRGVQQVHDTAVSVHFSRPIGFNYEAGDWVDLNFLDGNPPGGRTYSLSSSPTEDELSITFRVGISPFKSRLQSLTLGDKLYINQYGNDYGFHLNQNRSSVLIAGGIGIAPFRGMVKEMSDTGSKNNIQLLYVDKAVPFVFAGEIDTRQGQMPNLDVRYIETKQLSRKKREKVIIDVINSDADQYFIAGPEAMVEATEHLLIDTMGVKPRDIRIDSFGVY